MHSPDRNRNTQFFGCPVCFYAENPKLASMWGSFTKDEKLLITFLLGLFAAGTLAVACMRQGQQVSVFSTPLPNSTPATTAARPVSTVGLVSDGRVDINQADAELLDTLPGISAAKAAMIVEYRKQHGGFHSVEELDNVSGIGPGTVAKLAKLACVSHLADAQSTATGGTFPMLSTPVSTPSSAVAASTPTTKSKSASENQGFVNINTASASELSSLKYVGDKLAERIIQYRQQHGAFAVPRAIMDVKGIGPRIFEANAPRIVVR